MNATALQSLSRSDAGVREVPLTKGFVATIDASDYPLIQGFKWRATGTHGGRVRYASTSIQKDGRKFSVQMHRIIMGAASGDVVDHINGDGLDNRRSNLRFCTHKQNMRNRRLNRNNSTGYKGVVLDRGRYRAIIMIDGRQTLIGCFGNLIQAARAYDLAAIKHFGEFARPNFPTHRDWLFPHEGADAPRRVAGSD